MDRLDQYFLEELKAALCNQKVVWEGNLVTVKALGI